MRRSRRSRWSDLADHDGRNPHLDEGGAVRDYFSIASGFDRKLTTQQVRKVIAVYRQEMVHD
jgi:hypothetical protein